MKMTIALMFVLATLAASAQKDTTISFKVFGNCGMCKTRIEKAAKDNGVRSASWSADTKLLTIQYNPAVLSPGKVHKAVAAVGHDTELEKAPDEVYKKLPDCCLYRDGDDHSHETEHSDTRAMGVIMEEDEKGNLKPLKGANVLVDKTSLGVSTGDNGFFTVDVPGESTGLTISYVGFEPKKVTVKAGEHLSIVLNLSKPLEGIKVVSMRKSTYVSPLSTIRTQVMGERELFKAACCNLSESFETNPSVDVSFNDAVTGSKQIQLLGLSGNYTQLTLESLPGPRGIATPWGLNSVPGTWVESIQLSKGVGSVVNGFESIAGQINVELKKPETGDQLYANAYVNNMGKTDINLDMSRRLGKRWSTALLLHDAFLTNGRIDFNKDGFRDQPTGNLFTLMNRWKFSDPAGVEGQFGVRVLLDNKIGGETEFDPDRHKLTTDHYGLGIRTTRMEAFAKLGYVFPEKRYKSIGLQLSAFRHDQDSYFGTMEYNARQNNIYANLIYQSIISNTNHKFRTGLSLISDDYDEVIRNTPYARKEVVPGAFFEYTFSPGEKYTLIAGLRGDHNSVFGFYLTPRLHMRYEPVKGTTIRIAAGRGQRTANIFAENSSVLVSARDILVPGGGKAYGLDPEIAWNEGITIDQKFRLFNKSGSVALDFFRTDFQNQVIVDLDASAREVKFYNLEGRSFSNSFQAELNYELARKLDLRLAYRLFDVKATYGGRLLQRPLLSKHRGFANLGWETGKWKFDYTVSVNGPKRIPFTGDNPVAERMPEYSPSYVLMNAQVTRSFGKNRPFDWYVGSENLTNYFQDRVIIGAEQPFGGYFDASMIWGPVSGRMFYTGIRFRIK